MLSTLRTRPLPKEAHVLVSLKDYLPSAVHYRKLVISDLEGYPSGSHVYAHLWKLIDVTSTTKMFEGIKKIRDIATLSAIFLERNELLEARKYQLQQEAIRSFLAENASELGGGDLIESEDLNLAAYLTIVAEPFLSGWVLDHPSAADQNMHLKIERLYKTLLDSSAPLSLYNPPSNAITTVGALLGNTLVIDVPKPTQQTGGNSVDFETKMRRYSDRVAEETTIYTFGVMRVIDHVLSLLHHPSAWHTFLQERGSGDDKSENVQRAASLRRLASFMQSLLLYPHVFRYEMFRESFSKLEKWHGRFPAVNPQDEANYQTMIAHHDILGVTKDAVDLVNSFDNINSPDLGGTKLNSLIDELHDVFRNSQIRETMTQKSSRIDYTALTEVEHLRSLTIAPLLYSQPLARFNMESSLFGELLERAVFSKVTQRSVAYISSGLVGYYPENSLTELKALNFNPVIGWGIKASLTHKFTKLTPILAKDGHYPANVNALPATSSTDYHLNRDIVFSYLSAQDLVAPKEEYSIGIINEDTAQELAALKGYTGQTMYPSTMLRSHGLVDIKDVFRTPTDIRQRIEDLTQVGYAHFYTDLSNIYTQERWATVLSSFCLLVDLSDPSIPTVIKGLGEPYGVSYKSLFTMQGVKPEDVITLPTPVTDDKGEVPVGLILLKKVPKPSDSLAIADFDALRRVVYFSGGDHADITHLVIGNVMLHFALKPNDNEMMAVGNIFDRRFVYTNNTLLLSMDGSSLPIEESDMLPSCVITEEKWTREKSNIRARFKRLGTSYIAGASLAPASVTEESIAHAEAEITAELERISADEKRTILPPTPISIAAIATAPPKDESHIKPAKNSKFKKNRK